MFRIDLLQNQWLWASLAVGLVLVFATALAYLGWWKATKPGRVPWIIGLTYVAMLVFMVAYTIWKSVAPPNW